MVLEDEESDVPETEDSPPPDEVRNRLKYCTRSAADEWTTGSSCSLRPNGFLVEFPVYLKSIFSINFMNPEISPFGWLATTASRIAVVFMM